MSFKFQCTCGQHYLGTETLVGRKLLCKACRTKVVVPGPDSNGKLPVARECVSVYAGRLPGTRPLPTNVERPEQDATVSPQGLTHVEPPLRFPTQEAKSVVVPLRKRVLQKDVCSQEVSRLDSQAEFETPPEGLQQAISELAEFANDLKRMHDEEEGDGDKCSGEMDDLACGITKPYGKRDLAVLLGAGFRRACSSVAVKRS